MKRLFSPGITSTITFFLSILVILVIAVSAPGMVQAVLGPGASPASLDSQPGDSIMASSYYEPKVNPAANFGSLTDNGTAAYMGIGTNTPVSPLHIYSTSSTQPETIDLDGAQPITAQWNDYSTGGSMSGSGFLARFARGSRSSPANVTNGDRLGFNVFGGWAGGAFRHTGAIEALVDTGTVSASSLPTYMRFSTTPDGAITRTERMRIAADGSVGIGTPPYGGTQLSVLRTSGTAINGTSNSSGEGVYGAGYAGGWGVHGYSDTSRGVYGVSDSGAGVYGKSTTGDAGYFEGQIRTTSKLAYTSPRTHYYSVDSTEFVPMTSSINYQTGYSYGGVSVNSPDYSDMVATVHLPDGALVTGFTVVFVDSSSYDLTVTLYRNYIMYDNSRYSMADVTTSGSSGLGTLSDNTISSPTIDNSQYTYCVDAHWDTAAGTNLRIYGARITYTIAEAE